MHRFIVISGCSGGGKSTLLAELSRLSFPTIEEPGRRVVRRITAMAQSDYEAARALPGPVFFDRGLIDAAVALEHLTGEAVPTELAARRRYASPVFLAPPWPELFVSDAERRHDFASAVAEYDRLAAAYPALGYDVVTLPKVSIAERVVFVLERVGAS
jgi:predicted ATPase